MDSDQYLKLKELERARQMAEEDAPIEPTSSPIDLLAGGLAGGARSAAQMIPKGVGMMVRSGAKEMEKAVAREAMRNAAKKVLNKQGSDIAKEAAGKSSLDKIREKTIFSYGPRKSQGEGDLAERLNKAAFASRKTDSIFQKNTESSVPDFQKQLVKDQGLLQNKLNRQEMLAKADQQQRDLSPQAFERLIKMLKDKKITE